MKTEGLYKNGQKTSERKGDILTYYFKTGVVKARGKYIDDMMEGKWIFNRENGKLWQVGNFKKGIKQGKWIRYNKNGDIEMEAFFENGKKIKA